MSSTDPWFWLLTQILTTLLPQGSFWACTLPGWAQTKNQPCYHVHSTLSHLSIIANTLGSRRNRRHLADDIFKCIFLNGNVWILIKNSLKFVPKGPINNIPALVQIMAWHLILHIISISLHIHKVNTIPADALSPGHQKPWYQGLLFWCTKNDLISLSVQHYFYYKNLQFCVIPWGLFP